MTKRSFTIKQDKEIAQEYLAGSSSVKLARKYNVDKSTILNALKRQGIKRRKSKQEPDQKDVIIGMKEFGNRLLTPSEVDQAYKIYNVGRFSLSAISQAYRFGKNGRGISEAFKRQGYETRGGKTLDKRQEDKAIKLYKDGLSSTQVAEELRASKHVIKRFLKTSNKVKTRKHTTTYKYSVNENIFDKIDNEISAYLLGFIYADGNVTDKVTRISISIKDKNHLKKLKALLECDYPIYTSKRSGGYKSNTSLVTLQVNNPKIASNLVNLGIVPNRSQFYKTVKSISDNVKNHFIRGYLDGDGCIRGNYNPSVTFVGQIDILEWIREVFYQELNTNPKLSIPKGKGIHYINFSGIHQAVKICKWLYKDATVWMERKKKKYENWNIPNSKPRKKRW